jgi:general secretion pathway protein K
MALIVVLWGLALVGMAVTAITMATHSQALVARNAVENARARLAAEAGVEIGLRRLLAAARTRARGFDGTAEIWRDGEMRVAIAIRDEEGKVDLNVAPVDVLRRLLAAAGADQRAALDIACRIVGRRGFLPPPCPPDAPLPVVGMFAVVEELRHLSGMTDALYARVAPQVTVYSGSSAIDPSVASREVLEAVPALSKGSIDSLLERRMLDRGKVPEELLRDRRWFALSTSQTFTVAADAVSPGGARHRVEAVIRLTPRTDRPYVVLSWREPPSS